MSQTAPLHNGLATTEPAGHIGRLFHRWLSALRKNAIQLSPVSVSLGSTPVVAGSFTITDTEINPGSNLLVIADPDDEENAMEPLKVTGYVCSAGSALVEWESDAGHGVNASGAFDLGAATGTRTFLYGVSG